MGFYDLSIFAILLLLSLLVIIFSSKDKLNIKNSLFKMMIYTAILMNVLDILGYAFDTLPGSTNLFFNRLFNFLFTALGTTVVGLWACYIDYIIFRDYDKLKKKWYYFLPVTIMLILSIINLFTPILYVIGEDNVYQRLPMIWSSIPLTIALYVYILILVIKNADKNSKSVIIGVLTFLLLPIIASIIQLQFYGVQLIWPITSLAIVITYLIFETTSNSRDYLTGAFSRQLAEEIIEQNLRKKKNFAVIMVDMDHFKEINDSLGHHFGDRILTQASLEFQRIFNKKSVVSRFGGDEFIIVTEIIDRSAIESLLNEVRSSLREYDFPEFKERIGFTAGFSFYLQDRKCNLQQLMIEADKDMYKTKTSRDING